MIRVGIFSAAFLAITLCVVMPVCDKVESSINKGLEEEKSYSRHAMEYHRAHPNKRKGDRVVETWSTADYIAQAVRSQKISGDWADFSDQLGFLRPDIKSDPSGRPSCVVQRGPNVLVIDFLSATSGPCTVESTQRIETARIESGDMEFSGRSDYWVYVLRPQSR
jgi:hypothetical protein